MLEQHLNKRPRKSATVLAISCALTLTACDSDEALKPPAPSDLSTQLSVLLDAQTDGAAAFILPDSDNLANIPQDPNNPLTAEKVALGKLLYHDTAFGTESTDPERAMNYSCASCHHAAAGFKAGIPQGIGDGGTGFGTDGSARVLVDSMDAMEGSNSPLKPDLQPVTSPTILNSAYQSLMLWNGAFGNSGSSPNEFVAGVNDAGPPHLKVNTFGLAGLETQVLAGTRVHRLRFDKDSLLQTDPIYREMFYQAFPNADSGFIPDNGTRIGSQALGAAKAIAAYERTVMANDAPFQQWLKGDHSAMTTQQLRGAVLFFDKANCTACHQGPALSSVPGASAEQMFQAIGFADFNTDDPRIHGVIDDATSKGRGGFTGNPEDNYKFKIPTLYNLTDTTVFGHGASFRSVREVLEYKNAAVAQNPDSVANLSANFVALGLSETDLDDLQAFVEQALHDSALDRYTPAALPTGRCFPVADFQSSVELGCLIPDPDENASECDLANASPDRDSDADGWVWQNGGTCRIPVAAN